MGVTKRFALVLALCAVLIALAGLTGGNTWAVLACVLTNLAALALLIADAVLTPKPREFTLTREYEEKLSLGAVSTISVKVRSNGSRQVRGAVCDDLPEYISRADGADPAAVIKDLPPYTDVTFEYAVKPLKRGEFRLPRIHLRYDGVLGMVRRKTAVDTPESVLKVYPNMRDLSRYGISSLSRSLLISGVRQVRAFSDNGDFDSIREYNELDSMRSVNWAATARARKLMVNTFSPERNQYVYVMLDASRVMNNRHNNITMLDYGINAAFLLSDYCIRGGDNIGIEVFSSSVMRFVRAGKGSEQFRLLSDQLYNVEQNEQAADYGTAALELSRAARRRSLVFVFTQLFNLEEAQRFLTAVKRFLGGHTVCAITIKDPRTEELAKAAAEPSVRSAALNFRLERRRISALLTGAGIMNMDIEPDKLSMTAVSVYLDLKRRGSL